MLVVQNRAIDDRGLSPHKIRSLVGCSPNSPEFSRRAGAAKSLCHKNNYNARFAADLRARSAVGCNRLLAGDLAFYITLA